MFVFAEDARNYTGNANITQLIGLDVDGCRVWMEKNEDKRFGWCVMAAQFGGHVQEVVYASGFNDDTVLKTTDANNPQVMSMVGQAVCADVLKAIQTDVVAGKLGTYYDHTKAQTAATAWYTAVKADPASFPKAWWDAPAGG